MTGFILLRACILYQNLPAGTTHLHLLIRSISQLTRTARKTAPPPPTKLQCLSCSALLPGTLCSPASPRPTIPPPTLRSLTISQPVPRLPTRRHLAPALLARRPFGRLITSSRLPVLGDQCLCRHARPLPQLASRGSCNHLLSSPPTRRLRQLTLWVPCCVPLLFSLARWGPISAVSLAAQPRL